MPPNILDEHHGSNQQNLTESTGQGIFRTPTPISVLATENVVDIAQAEDCPNQRSEDLVSGLLTQSRDDHLLFSDSEGEDMADRPLSATVGDVGV